jgi:hypothetical protein
MTSGMAIAPSVSPAKISLGTRDRLLQYFSYWIWLVDKSGINALSYR